MHSFSFLNLLKSLMSLASTALICSRVPGRRMMHSDDDAPKDLLVYCGLAGGATKEGGETTGCLRCVKGEGKKLCICKNRHLQTGH
jgi:hypothetical protein